MPHRQPGPPTSSSSRWPRAEGQQSCLCRNRSRVALARRRLHPRDVPTFGEVTSRKLRQGLLHLRQEMLTGAERSPGPDPTHECTDSLAGDEHPLRSDRDVGRCPLRDERDHEIACKRERQNDSPGQESAEPDVQLVDVGRRFAHTAAYDRPTTSVRQLTVAGSSPLDAKPRRCLRSPDDRCSRWCVDGPKADLANSAHFRCMAIPDASFGRRGTFRAHVARGSVAPMRRLGWCI